MVRFISASVMHSKTKSPKLKKSLQDRHLSSQQAKILLIFDLTLKTFNLKLLLIITFYFILFTSYLSFLNAEIRDRVVAYVDNDAITLSELEERYAHTIEIEPDITKEEVLNTMVNRLLLLREAKNIKLEATSEDALIKEYIDLKVKVFIRIKEEEIIDFYNQHKADFQEKGLETVRDEIENVLTEKALNEHLKSHIEELKKKACVKIQLYK